MRIGIKVLGCPKNEADCEILAGILKKRGHEIVKNVEDADVVILDTCAFIEDAKRESISEIFEFVDYKLSTKQDLKLIVKGCLVQRYGRILREEIPEVDGWFGVVAPERLVEALERGEEFFVPTTPEVVYSFSHRCSLDNRPYSYIKISDGCDRGCTFCSIPKFKGKFRSRKIEDILKEARYLIESGKKEIILVAQDTTGYGIDIYGNQALPELLRGLNSLEGKFWIRVMYLHPDFLTQDIIETMCSLEKVVKYFDVPIQHASDEILRRMGRMKKSEELMELFERIRRACPDAVLRTSVIVGFPGERDEDFEKLMEFVTDVGFDKLGVFVYSDEEGTVAHEFSDKVDKEVAEERKERLLLKQADISFEKLNRFLEKEFVAVLEDRENGFMIGRTWMDAPEIDGVIYLKGKGKIGDLVKVRVEEHDEYDMKGVILCQT
ncbi:MAG: 30S ribosomal protein S12 methylthiotransferase RimO [Thermotogaceae bacterium]|nr:30S ribosomal protein S12 methylthiotransferase RimO [Thermotogaceae bacterium]